MVGNIHAVHGVEPRTLSFLVFFLCAHELGRRVLSVLFFSNMSSDAFEQSCLRRRRVSNKFVDLIVRSRHREIALHLASD